MFCPSCNAPNREDAKFCKTCGHALRIEQASEPEQVSAASTVEQSPSVATVSQEDPQATALPSEEQPLSTMQDDDPSLAPTLILTPEKVMAHRSRFWQMGNEEVRKEQQLKESPTASASSEVP